MCAESVRRTESVGTLLCKPLLHGVRDPVATRADEVVRPRVPLRPRRSLASGDAVMWMDCYGQGTGEAPERKATGAAGRGVPLALVIVWSASQPHRAGDIAFLPFGVWVYLGRGDIEIEKFAHFVCHQPGALAVFDPRLHLLTGDLLSRRQLWVRWNGVEIEVEVVGRCPTYFNGKEATAFTMRPGDTVMCQGELVLLCVAPPKELPRPLPERELQAVLAGNPTRRASWASRSLAWQLRSDIAAAAASDDHIRVGGETGTGKDLAALGIHEGSARADRPFVAHNMATVTPTLAEPSRSSVPWRINRIQARPRPMGSSEGRRDGDAYFLDEIGECPDAVSAALLRTLQTSANTNPSVGTSHLASPMSASSAQTHRDDSFLRQDLRGRLEDVVVRVPALRERAEDIPLLIRHLLLMRARQLPATEESFLQKSSAGTLEPRIRGSFVDFLVRQRLSRNIRELEERLIQSYSASPNGELRMPSDDVSSSAQSAREVVSNAPPPEAAIREALDLEKWNVSKAAERLGRPRRGILSGHGAVWYHAVSEEMSDGKGGRLGEQAL